MNNPLLLIIVSLLFAAIPFFLSSVTSFLKINIVIGILRSGLGTQNTPSNLLVGVLSLALTLFIMRPVFNEVSKNIQPEMIRSLTDAPTLEKLQGFLPAIEPLQKFMLRNSGKRELMFLSQIEIERKDSPPTKESLESSWGVSIAGFMLTELREAFSMAFLVLLPFLLIDIVVSLFLAGLGMYMVSPTTLTLPLKLLLFVSSDAWLYLIKGLIQSYS